MLIDVFNMKLEFALPSGAVPRISHFGRLETSREDEVKPSLAAEGVVNAS